MNKRASWDYPDCPDCESDVLVGGTSSNHDQYECHGCGTVFEPNRGEAADE